MSDLPADWGDLFTVRLGVNELRAGFGVVDFAGWETGRTFSDDRPLPLHYYWKFYVQGGSVQTTSVIQNSADLPIDTFGISSESPALGF